MLIKFSLAGLLVAITVTIHAFGLALLLGYLQKRQFRPSTRLWTITWLLIRLTWSLILIHLLEITVWALFYVGWKCLPDAESAFYFSGVTYATIGYGDLVLPEAWRIFGPLQGLTGILMCGLSTGFFFAVVNRIFVSRAQAEPH